MDPSTALNEAAGWIAKANPSPETSIRFRAYANSLRYDAHRFLCPRCWVAGGVRNPMRSVPGTKEYDVLVCNVCGADVVIPFDEG